MEDNTQVYIDILNNFRKEMTEIQIQYAEAFIKYGTTRRVAELFDRNTTSVRRSLNAIIRKFGQRRSSSVPEYDTSPVSVGFGVDAYSAYYNSDGKRQAHWIKAKRDQSEVYQDLLDSMEDLSKQLPKVPEIPTPSPSAIDPDVMAIYPLGDPHIGLLSYEPETGNDWDLTIAESVFLPLFDKLVKTAPQSKECLVIDLGDFWHYDGMEQRTMRSGHKVDADGRPSKMVQVGFRIMRQMIESALTHHEIVHVVVLPGNHDDLGSIFLRTALYHIYMDNPRVKVSLSPNVFQYHIWGLNLVGMHHGDKCKMQQLPMVMAADKHEEWGKSKFRHWYVGHFHNDSAWVNSGKELQGCKMETFRTIVGSEGYAHEAGYRSDQDGKAIILHKDYGEVSRFTVNISQVR